MRRGFRFVAGGLMMVLGLAGLVLPLLQGWLFIALGALILAPEVPALARVLRWVESRYPMIKRSTARLRRTLGERPPSEGIGKSR